MTAPATAPPIVSVLLSKESNVMNISPPILLPEIAVQSIIQKRIFLSNTPLSDPII